MYQHMTREEIIEHKALCSDQLAEGFESRYGRLRIFKHRSLDRYSLVKDIETNDFKLIHIANKYLRFKSVCQIDLLSQLEAVTSHKLEHGVISMSVALEYFPYDLHQETKSRIRQAHKVGQLSYCPSEAKVWYLIDSLVKIALYYKLFDAVHGDIQPKTVHINSLGQIRLMDNLLLFPKGNDNLSKAIENQAYRAALSPAQLKAFAKKQHLVLQNKYSSEIWSIGLTALSFASGVDMPAFYDWSAEIIKFQLIHGELHKLSKYGYSKHLVNLLKHLLASNQKDQPTLERIRDLIPRHNCAHSLFEGEEDWKMPEHSNSSQRTQQSLIDLATADLSPVKRIDPEEFTKRDYRRVFSNNFRRQKAFMLERRMRISLPTGR